MASEQVLDIPVRRHVLTSERPFQVVLDGIYTGISQPDIAALFATLAASTSYEEFAALVRHAQGGTGLMRFLQLDDDHVLALDPQARDQAGRRLVRLIAGNPVTMGQMTRHLPAAGSYAPVTILIQELPGDRTQVAYNTVASAIAPYADAAASQVAQQLDTEVLRLLRHATGMPATRNRGTPAPENALGGLCGLIYAAARQTRIRVWAAMVAGRGGSHRHPDPAGHRRHGHRRGPRGRHRDQRTGQRRGRQPRPGARADDPSGPVPRLVGLPRGAAGRPTPTPSSVLSPSGGSANTSSVPSAS